MEITGIDDANALEHVKVFHAGTKNENGKILSSGGRLLCVVALGDTLQEAKDLSYQAIAKIHMENSYYRRDIGDKGIRRLQNK